MIGERSLRHITSYDGNGSSLCKREHAFAVGSPLVVKHSSSNSRKQPFHREQLLDGNRYAVQKRQLVLCTIFDGFSTLFVAFLCQLQPGGEELLSRQAELAT